MRIANQVHHTLRSRYWCFCDANALDYDEGDLSAPALAQSGIVKYTRREDGKEMATGFAEAPFRYEQKGACSERTLRVTLRLGVHRNGQVASKMIAINRV